MTERPQRARVDRNLDGGRVRSVRRKESEGSPAQPRVIETPAFLVAAVLTPDVANLTRRDMRVLAAARQLADMAGEEGAVVAATSKPVAGLGAWGADRVVVHSSLGEGAEAAVNALAALWLEGDVRHLVLPDDAEGRDLALRLGAKLCVSVATGVYGFADGLSLRTGASGQHDFAGPPPTVLSVIEDAATRPASPREARTMEFTAAIETGRITQLGVRQFPADGIALSDAHFVIGAGAGVSDWTAFQAAAVALGAAPACTRVVADLGRMPRDRQVGASGSLIAAACYLAFGVSGAQQHLSGIEACERVIAVNTDPHAPIFTRADLGIVADADAVLRALVRRLRGAP